ncbi:hypothetical protein QBC47DRAFT_380156 [Echria macrotheca]|uniref:Uncharacterized protein n=1 Tax=Echria macrotheca TaxID=438768 RepID=A0AAJ0BIP3_9PEZI|nr:hypothetical protein QBC47DRAFT_380156 [Echria macrotheca]
MLSGHPPRWGEAGQTADDGTTQRPDDKSLFDRVVFWRTELLPSLPGHLQNPGRQAELSWGFVQQLNTLEEGFLAIFLARLGDNFPGAPSFTNDLELEMRRGTIHTIITEFRNRSDPDALSFRLGDVATRLMEDAVLKKGLTAQQILHRIADPDPPPMLTSQFVSGGDAARWYKTKNPATLLRRRLEEASRTGGNYSHVRPSLVNDTEYALGELELMCDGMEVQLKFWLKEREVIERVLV